MGLYRLTGWTIYTDNEVTTLRHKCGWEIYAEHNDPFAGSVALNQVRNHAC